MLLFLLWWNNNAIIWIKNLKKEHERDKENIR